MSTSCLQHLYKVDRHIEGDATTMAADANIVCQMRASGLLEE